jgi:phosphatidyl-myo-inositol dimannoside synthase
VGGGVIAPQSTGPNDAGFVRGSSSFMWPTRRVRRWVRSQAEEYRPDIVLFGAPHPLAWMGPRLRRRTGIPYAVLCHGAEVVIPSAIPVLRQLVRRPIAEADLVFAVSRYTAARVARLTGRSVAVVGAGVDTSFSPGEPVDGHVVGCVSRFVPRKGQRRVLRAVARLRSEGRRVEALMVGTGRDERNLRRLARRLDVPTRFEVGVPFADLPAVYRRMSVFAMPSRSRWLGLESEGLGLVYLEAAASGLPVVTGDSGGAPETVDPGVTGFVSCDDRTLAEALRRLVDDPDSARAMGTAGAKWVDERYSWDAVVARYLDAFAGVAGGE